MKKFILSFVLIGLGSLSLTANEIQNSILDDEFNEVSACCTRTVSNPDTGQSATATECRTIRRDACAAAAAEANRKLHELEVASGDFDLD
ncbi:MAG: hypothetical protein Q4G27_02480 [Flavobacteriaceae bacterium]|nr:hypothetical protein [Flavobacteriaceae bacterium]